MHQTDHHGWNRVKEASEGGFWADDIDEPASIIFRVSGLQQPDTKLMVFATEIHIHSVLPKLHSGYFRKFLDSADKLAGPASAKFHYEYITAIDEDGTWA